MGKLFFNLRLSKIFFLVIFVCNIALPWEKGVILKINVFHIIVVLSWLYGVMSQHGYFLKQVSVDEDGITKYEFDIPIIQVGATRVAEIVYFLLFKRGIVDWRVIAGLVVSDLLFIGFMLLDKMSYYYESEEMKNGD